MGIPQPLSAFVLGCVMIVHSLGLPMSAAPRRPAMARQARPRSVGPAPGHRSRRAPGDHP